MVKSGRADALYPVGRLHQSKDVEKRRKSWLHVLSALVTPRSFSILARRRSSEFHAGPVHWCPSSSHDGKARRRRHAAGLDLSYALLQIDQRHRAL